MFFVTLNNFPLNRKNMYVFMYTKTAANINFIKSKYENISDIFLKFIAFEKIFLKFHEILHMIKKDTSYAIFM